MRMLRDERGNVLILAALSMTMLMSFMAFGIDVGYLYNTQRQLQTLADAAALAGALEASQCSAANCSYVTNAATTAITENGQTSTLFTQCAAASGTGILLTVNNGPCVLGVSDPNNGDKNYVEAVVTENVPTFFARIFGVNTVTISARAEAGKASAGSSPCLNAIGTTGQNITLNSGASITDGPGSNCGVNTNSSGTPAVMENSGVTVNVGSYTVHGGVTKNGGSYTPSPTLGSPVVPDPFASLTAPVVPAQSSSCCGPINGATTLQPGYYPWGLNFNGGGYTVNLAPGLYYFGSGINVGAVNLVGSGVTIYMASGQINMNSAAQMTLTAPTSALSNCASCAGMLIWQPASNTSQMNLDSGSNSGWGGAIYLPGAQLTLNGGSYVTSYGMVVAQSLMLNSAMQLSCSTMPGGVCPGGGSGSANGGSTTISLAE